jgi:starch synthase
VSSPRKVAIVAGGDSLEDWIPEELSFDAWLGEESGGWMFNYVDALARAGVRSLIVTHTENATEPQLHTHRPTGADVLAVPPVRHLAKLRAMERTPPPTVWRGSPIDRARGVRGHWLRYRSTAFRSMLRGLRAADCDAILSQDYEGSRFDACVVLGKILRVPVFATFQGVTWHVSSFERLSRRPAIRASAGLVIGAQVEIDRVRREYSVPEEKIAKIPNPLDVGQWDPVERAAAREQLGVPASARIAISHGRIDIADKGLDVMLDAWKRLVASHPGDDLRLILLGYGPDVARLRETITADRIRGVELGEYVVDHDSLRRHLSAADVFAFAGRYEGFPVAPTEAMACGLPVVATAAAGISDIFERGEDSGGIVIAVDDTDALTRGLARVLDDPDFARQLGERARKRVEQFCSLDTVGAQLTDFMVSRGMRAA